MPDHVTKENSFLSFLLLIFNLFYKPLFSLHFIARYLTKMGVFSLGRRGILRKIDKKLSNRFGFSPTLN
jgi:hypothetical protein